MDYSSLPDADDDAFVQFTQIHMQNVNYRADGNPDIDDVEKLRTLLAGALEIFDTSVFLRNGWTEFKRIKDYQTAGMFMSDISAIVELYDLKRSRSTKGVVFDAVFISENFKEQIRCLVGKIKSRIAIAELPVEKSDSLYQKLNIFLNDLDKDRTNLAAFTAAFVQVSATVGSAAEKLEPAIALFERVMKAIGLGSNPMPGLPKSAEEMRQLPPPSEESKTDEDQQNA